MDKTISERFKQFFVRGGNKYFFEENQHHWAKVAFERACLFASPRASSYKLYSE